MNPFAMPTQVFIGPHELPGDLVLPASARALIVFAHGSGSTRRSPRNQLVSHALQVKQLGTLLFDLLTPQEAEDRANVFDIPLLGSRVGDALQWIERQPALAALPAGLFGASTGAAAALTAAAARPDRVYAVVSRGGRPDLAEGALPDVRAPTLLVVGSLDEEVLALNRRALRSLPSSAQLMVVPRATHLFEEAGTLEQVARLATDWFITHLPPA